MSCRYFDLRPRRSLNTRYTEKVTDLTIKIIQTKNYKLISFKIEIGFNDTECNTSQIDCTWKTVKKEIRKTDLLLRVATAAPALPWFMSDICCQDPRSWENLSQVLCLDCLSRPPGRGF